MRKRRLNPLFGKLFGARNLGFRSNGSSQSATTLQILPPPVLSWLLNLMGVTTLLVLLLTRAKTGILGAPGIGCFACRLSWLCGTSPRSLRWYTRQSLKIDCALINRSVVERRMRYVRVYCALKMVQSSKQDLAS